MEQQKQSYSVTSKAEVNGSPKTNRDYYVFPPSFQQEALWFLDQLDPGLSAYNLTMCNHIHGPLRVAELEKSVQLLVDRHEALRTSFRKVNDQISQVIHKKVGVEISHILVNDFDQAYQKAQQLANIGFDLADKSMLRTTLIKYGNEKYLLLFVVHHIIFDGWSVGLFQKELTEVYNSINDNLTSTLPELELQYADFAIWQRKWFKESAKDKQVKFWKETLGDNAQPLELPTDKLRPARQSFKGGRVPVKFEGSLAKSLKELSIQESCTMFMTIVSALNLLLFRYSGQSDISIGTPMANRQAQELEIAIGYFVNTVVIRTDLTGNPTFRELLKRTRKKVLDIFDNQDLPFDKLVEELKPDRGLSMNPLFQVMLALQPASLFDNEMTGVSSEPISISTGTSKFDLSFELKEGDDGITGFIEFSSDLFERSSAQRLVDNFEVLLEQIVLNPDQTIDNIPIHTPSEKQFLLEEINQTLKEYSQDQCLHQWFENQAATRPLEIAIIFQNDAITYEELNQRSNQLAHYLISKGAQPDQLVGLCVDRGIDMVVGLLGILKAGAAYLPMDPMFPRDRLAYMLSDASAPLLVTSLELIDTFPQYSGEIILIDSQWTQIEQHEGRNPLTSVNPSNLAYVIYTSGSTGKPKGVQLEHSSVVNFLNSMQQEPGMSTSDVLLSVTTLSFDIAVLEIFLPLVTGAQLVLVDKQTTMDGRILLDEISKNNVTVMQATPATWRLMINAGWQKTPNLKILCGGETMPRDLATQLLDKGKSLWNEYGPTETTIWSTLQKVENRKGPITIGHPIANTQIYILDKQLQLVPRGAIGELYIGGDGLARGYLNREELTNERFIKNPFSSSETSKIYKTGDNARILPNGEIECLGRIDFQVKIRGFRIELGEIETCLKSHPEVNDAVVSIQGVADAIPRLVGYVIARNNEVSTGSLKQFLAKELPDYMIPGVYVQLTSFPLTPNGKIDRKSLPKPDGVSVESNDYAEASNEVESKLVKIWEKLLGVTRVGITDSFFDIGGHSLLAAHMFMDIEKEFKKSLPLATLFESPTIQHLARMIHSNDTVSWSSLVPIQPKGIKTPLFLVHGAEGNILLYRELAEELSAFGQPVYALQSQGLNVESEFIPNVEAMAEHYIDEMLQQFPNGPYIIGGYCLGGTIALEMARQLVGRGKEIGPVIMLETYNIQAIDQTKRTKLAILFNKIQNVIFHIENIFLSEQWHKFFNKKYQLEKTRFLAGWSLFKERAKHGFKKVPDKDFIHLKIADLNDEAQAVYKPEQIEGKIVLIRPRKFFNGLNDPEFGWNGMATEGVELVHLPISPRGMLVEPFASLLAKEINQTISNIEPILVEKQ